MAALVKRRSYPPRTRTSIKPRWVAPSDAGLEHDLEQYRFDLVALTLLMRGLSDALRFARMQEIARGQRQRARRRADPRVPRRPLQAEDLVAYG